MEQTTHSPFVLNIYAGCGNSGLYEYGTDGDMSHVIWPGGYYHKTRRTRRVNPLSTLDKLGYATQAALGVAAVHNAGRRRYVFDGKSGGGTARNDDDEGEYGALIHPIPPETIYPATTAHTDIKAGQFINVNGMMKLNDFNRAQFLLVKNRQPTKIHHRRDGIEDDDDGRACTFYYGSNGGKYRSPEEYKYRQLTEKIDLFALGNIFYELLEQQYVFYDVNPEEKVYERVMRGERPKLTTRSEDDDDHHHRHHNHIIISLGNGTSPAAGGGAKGDGDDGGNDDNQGAADEVADADAAARTIIVEAARSCWEQNPGDRPTANEIASTLVEGMRKLDPGRLNRWGIR